MLDGGLSLGCGDCDFLFPSLFRGFIACFGAVRFLDLFRHLNLWFFSDVKYSFAFGWVFIMFWLLVVFVISCGTSSLDCARDDALRVTKWS